MISDLRKRVLEVSKELGLSHVGSSLSAVDILDEIYPKGEVIVSSGHAGIAYFAVVEKYTGVSIEEQYEKFGIHAQMYGSLGHGLGVALGKAIANPDKEVYCLTSDGEWCEGSMWECLRLATELEVYNLHIYINANGYGGMGKISARDLKRRLKAYDFPIDFRRTNNDPLNGLSAHYEKVV